VKFSGWSSLAIGLLMLLQWGFFLASGTVPEVRTAPIAVGFHLAAEATTAVALIVAGLMLLKRDRGAALGLVANGMLVYTVIVSPGYFAQLGQWSFVGMFAVLLIIAVVNIVKLTSVLRA
jgi:hypothetical protein